MSPNGTVILGLILIAGAVVAHDLTSLAVMLAVTFLFALGSRRRIVTALLWSGGIVLPLAAFMGLVWILIVGRAPAEIAANAEGSRTTAAIYVAATSLRLFIIAFAVQASFLHFAGWTPLRFVRGITAPRVAKKLMVLTLSLVETMLQAVDRARTALIAAGIITRKSSLRNLRHGWILVQTVWLTVVTIAIGRTRDKWPIEDTLARLDHAVSGTPARRFGATDAGWIALGVAAFGLAVGLG